MPKVSVIIPVYNVEKYLRECLDSVCAQTLTDWECICVDDGSTDSSPAILEEYAAKDKRFRVVRREHSNAGACRNAGLDLAHGEYLSFLDSDDIFAPRMLEIHVYAIERACADISECRFIPFDDGTPFPHLDDEFHNNENFEVIKTPAAIMDVFSMFDGAPWQKMFRRLFIQSLGIRFQELRWTNDSFFIYSALANSRCIVRLHQKMIAYRKRVASLQDTRDKQPDCLFEAFGALYDRMTRDGFFRIYPKQCIYFKRFFVLLLLSNLDIVKTWNGYKDFHQLAQDFFEKRKFVELTMDFFNGNIGAFERFILIRDGGTPFDSMRLRERQLKSEISHLRSIEYLRTFRAYRTGEAILRMPRLLKRLIMKLIGKN